ncbi:hypothetical protein B9Z19DRAFT_1120762 [Tuber borchii]|uniref:Uncharacterized protein n=1 Tax=Tuber borchii TaxID=42251 RepID=A0A2T7A3V8_TUBBO|nr:hypothetical protein B9Z19DRAFT_1120762 [Tuber borchii]
MKREVEAAQENGQSTFRHIFGSNCNKIEVEVDYGDKIGEYEEKAMSWNIEEYASVKPPALPKDTQYKDYKNGSFRIHTSAHAKLGSVTTKDTKRKGHMKKAVLPLFKAMEAITRAQRILLAAVDLECLQEYEKIIGKCLDHRTSFETDE